MQWLDADLRFALRTLRRAPLFTAVAMLSLALGIGANTAVFSLIDQVVLRPLPVRNPSELVLIKSPGPRYGHTSADENGAVSSWSYPIYKDFRDQNQVFSGVAGHYGFSASLAIQDGSQYGSGELVTGNYFGLLGVGAALGRVLTPDDDLKPGAHPVVVLSHAYWTSRLGADASVLNQTLLVNGQRMSIVGVAQRGFFGVQVGYQPQVFVPMAMKPQMTPIWSLLDLRNDHWLHIIARLKPGVTREQAVASLQPLFRGILRMEADQQNLSGQRRERFLARTIQVEPGAQGRGQLRNEAGPMLYALMVMVALVLMIACANVANLLLARAAAREKEIAVRLAMGAGRLQLMRQLLVESLLLGLLGGAAGLLAASWTLEGLLRFLETNIDPKSLSASLDGRELAFHFALAVVTGLLFGLAPAIQGTRPDLAVVLKSLSSSLAGGGAPARIRKILVAGQIALTLLLVTGAGLFAKSLIRLQDVDLGLQAGGVAQFSVSPIVSGYPIPEARHLVERLRTEIAGLPGVRSAAFARVPLFTDTNDVINLAVEGYTPPDEPTVSMGTNYLSAGYFWTMRIPLVSGREFTAADLTTSPKICVISETAARRYFEGRNPVGRHLMQGSGTTRNVFEIVGVVKDSHHSDVRSRPGPYVYLPNTQVETMGPVTFYVRTAQDPSGMLPALREAVRRLDANLPVSELRTLEQQVTQNLLSERMLAILTSVLSGIAILLAVLGIYGLLAFIVAQRTREIGLRMALGADAGEVRSLILKDVAKLTLAGAAVGLPAAYVLAKLAESLLYGVTADDLTISVAALAILIVVALAGAYLPARRATRIDPMSALRMD